MTHALHFLIFNVKSQLSRHRQVAIDRDLLGFFARPMKQEGVGKIASQPRFLISFNKSFFEERSSESEC
jgi:hypothetical protein